MEFARWDVGCAQVAPQHFHFPVPRLSLQRSNLDQTKYATIHLHTSVLQLINHHHHHHKKKVERKRPSSYTEKEKNHHHHDHQQSETLDKRIRRFLRDGFQFKVWAIGMSADNMESTFLGILRDMKIKQARTRNNQIFRKGE